jgi:hypothetical protein
MNVAAKTDPLPTEILPADRLLTVAEFQKLADVPPEVEFPGAIETPSSMAGILPKRWPSSGRSLTWPDGLAKRWR